MAAAVFLMPTLLNLIPLASLAAILIYTGFKLAHPTLVRHTWNQGATQFVPFVVTVVAILLTDLLVGILVGLAVGFIFVLFDQLRYPCYTVVSGAGSVLKRVRLHEQVTFLNKASLAQLLDELPPGSRIEIDGLELPAHRPRRPGVHQRLPADGDAARDRLPHRRHHLAAHQPEPLQWKTSAVSSTTTVRSSSRSPATIPTSSGARPASRSRTSCSSAAPTAACRSRR